MKFNLLGGFLAHVPFIEYAVSKPLPKRLATSRRDSNQVQGSQLQSSSGATNGTTSSEVLPTPSGVLQTLRVAGDRKTAQQQDVVLPMDPLSPSSIKARPAFQ